MFSIDIEESTLELKRCSSKETNAIIEFVNEVFNKRVSKVRSQVFKGYQKTDFLEAVLSNKTASGQQIDDFLVYKISFRGSPIPNSPKVVFQLKDMEIWPSVEYAHQRGCIDVKSLKDIESLSFKAEKVDRTVRSTIMENGDVLFTMDDGRMEREKKESICKKFFLKFGIPLYTLISNEQFEQGKIDKIDYVMGKVQKKDLDASAENVLSELISSRLMGIKTVVHVMLPSKSDENQAAFVEYSPIYTSNGARYPKAE
jgi:hypothetical protein